MRKQTTKITLRLLGVLYFIFWLDIYFTIAAQAYIDPATTAMVTQIVAGIFISAGVLFGVFRRKIVLFIKNLNVKRTQRKIERQTKKSNSEKD